MPNKSPCIFLDRDGVINREKSYIVHPDQLEIFDFAKEAIEIARRKGYKVIVITNQSAIARGMLSLKELETIHQKLRDAVAVDAIYACPHLPPNLGAAENEYVIDCLCRKPLPGMILQAARDFDIDLEKSFMVGDRASDILCGKNAQVKTVLVSTGFTTDHQNRYEIAADFYCDNILDFVNRIWGIWDH